MLPYPLACRYKAALCAFSASAAVIQPEGLELFVDFFSGGFCSDVDFCVSVDKTVRDLTEVEVVSDGDGTVVCSLAKDEGLFLLIYGVTVTSRDPSFFARCSF